MTNIDDIHACNALAAKLERCPVCDGEAMIYPAGLITYYTPMCKIRGCIAFKEPFGTPEAAVEAWNRRDARYPLAVTPAEGGSAALVCAECGVVPMTGVRIGERCGGIVPGSTLEDGRLPRCPGRIVAVVPAPAASEAGAATDLHVKCGRIAVEVVNYDGRTIYEGREPSRMELLARGYLDLVAQKLAQPPSARDELGAAAEREACALLHEQIDLSLDAMAAVIQYRDKIRARGK